MKRTMSILAAVMLLSACAWAQVDSPDEPEIVIPDGGPGSLPGASTEPADAEADRRVASVLEGMTPEELEQLVKQAMTLLREEERRMVASELQSGLLYDPEDVKKAVAYLQTSPSDTQADNVQRICKAFAMVDVRFGKGYALLEEGKAAEAAAAIKLLVNAQQATYLGAAKYFAYGQALTQAGRHEEAVDAFSEIWERMKDRTSLAAEAALRTAQAWEAAHRGYYALRMYNYYLNKYRLILDDAQRKDIEQKVAALKAVYADALGTVARQMGDVRQRLDSADSGKQTQQTQEQIVALLDDLIKTAEDQDGGGGGGSGDQQNKQARQGEGQGKEGQGNSGAGVGNNPSANPSSPANSSALRLGATVRGGANGEVANTDEAGDWSKLPPRERERLEQLRKKMLSERYQDIISDYHKRLAKQLSQ